MMHWIAVASFLLIKAAATPCSLPSLQKPDVTSAVSISGDVAKPFEVTAKNAGDFAPVHAEVRQPSDAGAIAGDFEGVSIDDLLRHAGAQGKITKAGLVDSILVARAALDDPSVSSAPYEVTLSYSEVSPLLSRRPAFLAFRCNGLPISPTLVVPDDRTDARYVHELKLLTFSVPK